MYVAVSYINGRHECVFVRYFTSLPFTGKLCTLSKTGLVPCTVLYIYSLTQTQGTWDTFAISAPYSFREWLPASLPGAASSGPPRACSICRPCPDVANSCRTQKHLVKTRSLSSSLLKIQTNKSYTNHIII